jgi:hypothetical protein
MYISDCWSHLLCLLWDIELGVAAESKILFRLGLACGHRSTVARANARHPWPIVAEFCAVLTATLSTQLPSRCLPVRQPLYIVDGTIIELCKTIFSWAPDLPPFLVPVVMSHISASVVA